MHMQQYQVLVPLVHPHDDVIVGMAVVGEVRAHDPEAALRIAIRQGYDVPIVALKPKAPYTGP